MRFFNTAGPVNCDKHYCLPPLQRFDLDEIQSLIDQEKYFILHAPRQVGKTSYMLALMEHLNREGRYSCLYVNVEMAQGAREDVHSGIQTILGELATQAHVYLGDSWLLAEWQSIFEKFGPGNALNTALMLWAQANPKPLVILIDEIDALVGDTLLSVLRQLRAGYTKRPKLFPQSMILCGLRDIRDYRIQSSLEKAVITGKSPFNIKAKSLRLGDFNRDEVEILYSQHSEETGQPFENGVMDLVWHLTSGQPWLVNALAYEVCFKMKVGRDRSIPITKAMIIEAKERIIQRRETHIDQLIDKLKEKRVQRVIEPMLKSEDLGKDVAQDDIQYSIDLGLISRDRTGLHISNAIYREVIPRELSFITQLNFESAYRPTWYIKEDGCLDMIKLMTAFQEFFRKNSEIWIERFDYKEAGPQLLLQAFLQRIVNGGGRIEREYGLALLRVDLLIVWPIRRTLDEPVGDAWQEVVLELKIRYGDTEKVIQSGLEKTFLYMDKCGTDDGHLVIFDRRENIPWEEKIFCEERSYRSKKIMVWGM